MTLRRVYHVKSTIFEFHGSRALDENLYPSVPIPVPQIFGVVNYIGKHSKIENKKKSDCLILKLFNFFNIFSSNICFTRLNRALFFHF